MIPHRMQSNEIFGHGLKDRVTACRKRLRVNRGAHKIQLIEERVAIGGHATAGFLDEYPAVESSVSRRGAPDFRDEEGWVPAAQEVGIT